MTAFHKSALLSLLLPYSPSSAGTASETIRYLNTDPITATAATEQEPKICREDVIIGSASCHGNNVTMCQEKCALYGTSSLLEKCCMYSGVSGTLLAYEESENWMRRINEFNKCTGANLRIKYQEGGEAAMSQALINDVGVDIHSGNGIYDAYIVRAPWMPPIYRGLRPLSEKIKGSAEYVRFNDINEVTREAVSFDGEIYALPVDSHYIAMGWRQDVFELHADYYQNIYGEELAVPKTIEQLVLVSERLNGLDHNGDGEPDWGFCFTPTTNQFFTFLAPVLQTNMHECDKMLDGSGFDCSHGSNTGQNIFFDVETFEPLIHNEGFRYVFDLYYRFVKSSNCQDSGDCDHAIDFPTGRCAGVLSLSDMMNTLLLDSIQPRYDNDGNVVWAPGQNLALGQHWGRRAIFPGSNKVVDWKAPGKPLIECTPEKCPLGKDGINYTPFFSQAGEAYAINGKVSKPRSADAMWDMFAWIAELPFADQPHQGLYRKSQLTDEYSVQLEENYNAVMAEDLRAVLEHYFRSQDEGNNPALDSRLRGFDEYDRKLGYELHDKLIFAKVSEGGLFSDDGPSLEAERNFQEYDERYNRFLSNVDTMFYEFNAKSEGGALGNLILWRNHLNIHPVKSEEDICSGLLARNPAVFSKLGCASAVDLESMCPTQKDNVEAYAPGTCISSSSSDKTITTVIVLCSVLGGAVLVLIFYFGYHRYKKYRKLATEQKQLTETILNDSVRSTKSIDYPFHLIRGDEFVNENKLLRFEVLRNTHRLTVLDTLKDVDAFIDAGKQIVFLSHQWTSFAAPDPSGTQYEAMCLALKELARQSGWDESLKDVFVWVDYCCLPQANTSAQNLTIRSVAAYAASATYFIMVAPETMHADLDEVCDIDTYQERVWTRVEQVCHAMRNGTDGIFITKGKASPLEKVKREFFNESFRMFEGELTCCRLEHKGMALCDRQCLVVPLLGLYGELYRETVVGSKGGSGQCFECVDDFLTEIEKRQDEIFPPTFKRTTWRKNKQSEETIQLFGDLISRMKCRIKNGDGFTIDDDNTTSTMGSDYVRHGATHGIRF